MSSEYCCTLPCLLLWSTKSTLPPTLVSKPNELPEGFRKPCGKGFGDAVGMGGCQPSIRTGEVLRRGRKSQRSIRGRLREEHRQRCVEDAVTASKDCSRRDGPSEAEARLEFGVLGISLVCLVASDTAEKQTPANPITQCRIRNFRCQRIRSIAVEAHCDLVVTFLQVRLVFIAQPKIDREIGPHPEIIVDIARIVTGNEPKWLGGQDVAAFRVAQK